MGSYQSLFPIFMNWVSIGEDPYQSSREILGVSDAFLEGCDFSGLMHVISQIEKFAVIIIIFNLLLPLIVVCCTVSSLFYNGVASLPALPYCQWFPFSTPTQAKQRPIPQQPSKKPEFWTHVPLFSLILEWEDSGALLLTIPSHAGHSKPSTLFLCSRQPLGRQTMPVTSILQVKWDTEHCSSGRPLKSQNIGDTLHSSLSPRGKLACLDILTQC